MPDPPRSKDRHEPARPSPRRRTNSRGPGYVELCCRTNYSFLEGASHPDELVGRAAELGHAALAITDRNSLAGVVRAHVAARESRLPLVCGAWLTFSDGPPLVVWVPDRAAWGRLSRLVTRGRRRAPKGECHLCWADLRAGASEGLLAGVPLHELVSEAPDDPQWARQRRDWLGRFADLFGDRGYALAGLSCGPDDRVRLDRMRKLAREAALPLVATNDVLYHVPGRQRLADVLAAIGARVPVSRLGRRRLSNGERHLKHAAAMAELFAECPGAVPRSVEVAERCGFSLGELKYEYPRELCPRGQSSIEYLSDLTWQGARRRYPGGVPPRVRELLQHELGLIESLQYESYFLTVWDLVRFARGRGILCQGRGSAANSAVCYCLGVTSVDPDRIDVLFERFVSRERDEAPDIDVDFEHERREEVLQYLYKRYGRERAGMTAAVISYRPRSALRDVGKALGLSPDRVDRLAKMVDEVHDDEVFASRVRSAGLDPQSRLGRQLIELVREILGFPRHLSQHIGGMVITRGPLCELVPIENAAMPDRTVIQWDKDDLDALGILKVDCLSLGMLTAIHRCLEMIEGEGEGEGESESEARDGERTIHDVLAAIPAEDPAVYEMISRADTVGVFQVESRAQMSMLPRLKPRCFYDLVIEVAIVRPGPIQGDMVHPYLRRRAGRERVTYPNEAIREVLHKTLGVPIFQEQAMRLAVVAAGFTPGEADQLRRAMGAWRRPGVIDRFREKLIEGMRGRGYDDDFAQRLFRQIQGFGEYGFPESHAASFALLVYVSAWLKLYHPAPFTASLLNSQPMGFYAPSQLVSDARRHGVQVQGVDVNHSEWDCTVGTADARAVSTQEQGQGQGELRLGLRMIRGLAEAAGRRIVAGRRDGGVYGSVDDLVRRTGLGRGVLTRLARGDAFASLGSNRRQALWASLPPRREEPLWEGREETEPRVVLPEMTPFQEVVSDYRAWGLSLRAHPFGFLREQITRLGAVPAETLAGRAGGERVSVAGLVLLRQRPSSARGITFMTLEDETGLANLIVKQQTWERYRQAARTARALLVTGTLQNQEGVIHVLADHLVDLSDSLTDLALKSRDFR